ncbi:aldo-keto reductase [Pseudohyphozyma bogoriensis]|nr:aldo-keto reductase [Pseudohyphozyma bogoriensis]
MEYTRVGTSGLKVSKVIFGCLSFGDASWVPWVQTLEEALPIMKHAYDNGINTFDTADTYSNGRSEEILGAFLKRYNIPRRKVVILTKCFFAAEEGIAPQFTLQNDGALVNQCGLSRKHIMDAIDASLKRLGTDYVDVLQIHRLDRDMSGKEIMRALNDVVESGKARYIGASSMATWEFHTLQNLAEKHNWHQFISMQGFHNLLYREEEREMLPFCQATGVGYLPWMALAAGVLTHPWTDRTDRREQSDLFLKALCRTTDEADEKTVGRVQELAERKGVSMAMVATTWTLRKGLMPVMGVDSVERIDETVRALKVELSEEEVQWLEELYLPKKVTGH